MRYALLQRRSRQVGNTKKFHRALARYRQQRTASSPIEFMPYDQAYEPGFEDMMRRGPSVKNSTPNRMPSAQIPH